MENQQRPTFGDGRLVALSCEPLGKVGGCGWGHSEPAGRSIHRPHLQGSVNCRRPDMAEQDACQSPVQGTDPPSALGYMGEMPLPPAGESELAHRHLWAEAQLPNVPLAPRMCQFHIRGTVQAGDLLRTQFCKDRGSEHFHSLREMDSGSHGFRTRVCFVLQILLRSVFFSPFFAKLLGS